MELREFGGGLKRHWIIFVVCCLIGLVGAFTYDFLTLLDEAQASVSVLDPMTARPGGYGQAQVTFDSIILSKQLANKVAAVMGESSDTVQSDLSVTLASSLSPTNPSPLYLIHGKDHGLPRAVKLVNTAVSEATKIYLRLNTADGSQLKAATAPETADAQAQLKSAVDALNAFATQNNAVDLPDRLATQQAKVAALQQSLYAAQAQQSGDYYVNSTLYTKDANVVSSLQASLAPEQTELSRLQGLSPQYSQLSFAVQAAQTRVTAVGNQEESQVVSQLLPSDTELKQLDAAYKENQFLYRLLIYSLGLLAGVVLGLLAVYLLVALRGRPATPAELASAFGAPVLIRVGSAN